MKHAHQKDVRFALSRLRKNVSQHLASLRVREDDVLLLNYEELSPLKKRVPAV